jgi:hypothetical protein
VGFIFESFGTMEKLTVSTCCYENSVQLIFSEEAFSKMTKPLIIATFALAASSLFAGSIGVGITIGPPPPPRVVAVPASPGPTYVWVPGYYYVGGGHRYLWHAGYYTRVPYEGARWIEPRYESGRYYTGYWEGSRGRIEHHHEWDRDHRRDYDRH